jgi:hypothetical protein|tara:strand:- start:111 stop:341 length:231 start_codon:yes stop_codon:yes gene_type:complete
MESDYKMEKKRSPHIVKVKNVGDRREIFGYEVKHIDFSSPWSREGGPEVTTKFFLNEDNARAFAKTLKPFKELQHG